MFIDFRNHKGILNLSHVGSEPKNLLFEYQTTGIIGAPVSFAIFITPFLTWCNGPLNFYHPSWKINKKDVYIYENINDWEDIVF